MKDRLISVALPVPIYKTFTYLIPDEIEKLGKGFRVLVPFGRRNLIGYTMDDEVEERENIKEIITVLDEEPFFEEELFSFLKEVSKFYLVPPALILKIAYPSELDPEIKKVYSLNPSFKDEVKDDSLKKLKEELEKGPKSYESLKSIFKKSTDRILSKALSISLIEKMEKLKEVKRRLTNDRIAPLLSLDEIERLCKEKGLTKYHLKIVDEIKKSFETFPSVKDIIKRAKVPSSYIKDLEEASLIELFDMLPLKLPRKPSDLIMTEEQDKAFNSVLRFIDRNEHKTFLLYGITGSGKTEIYLNLIEEVLKRGGSAIYLVPEISLASYLSKRLLERFGSDIAILHSSLNEKERIRQYLRIKKGEAKVVIGPRSALFSPLKNLKLIIVDEEHDQSFRQVEHPFYNARDMAVLRGFLLNIPVVLGSATPSIESFYNAYEVKKYELLTLSERVMGAKLPEVEIVDMRKLYEETKIKYIISPRLENEIEERLKKKEQVIILRNRLGYSTFILCRECGKSIKCKRCDVTMVFHRKRNEIKCHICGATSHPPSKCPDCGSTSLHYLGEGTEKVEDILKERFKNSRVERMDRDLIKSPKEYEKIFEDFDSGKIDILVGTQMIAKGYHNPNITLVGIISADFILTLPDFRSSERTFQLITQCAGRAGRGLISGKVIVQSFFPEHHAVLMASKHDYDNFYFSEIKYRKATNYPPITALGKIEIKDNTEEKSYELSLKVKEFLYDKFSKEARILGPSPSPISKIEGKYRFQLIIKAPSRTKLNSILSEFFNSQFSDLIYRKILLEVDPASLL